MDDFLAHDVDILTLDQYLQPTKKHLFVERYYHPDEFAELKEIALEKGFRHCESGPLVRSSYHADEQVSKASAQRRDRKSTRLNSSHVAISYAVFCLKKKQNA